MDVQPRGMKGRAMPMSAIPGWMVGGVQRTLTFRFVCAARSCAHSRSAGATPSKLRVHTNSFGMIVARPVPGVELGIWRAPSSTSFSILAHLRQKEQLRQSHCAILRAIRFASRARLTRNSRTAGVGKGDPLQPGDSKYIDWWEQKMNQCQKTSTRELIKRLVSHNLLGVDESLRHGNFKAGGMPHQVLEIKRRFPHEVVLTRVGEFYEAMGFDACVLAEYAGLNPMGGLSNHSTVPKAGCPIENLRQTLDALTRNGFSVCIVEEVKGPSNSKQRKERFVGGHAHPGNPYVYGLAEADFDVDFPDPVSIIGIARSASGYSLISAVELMRSLSVEDQLTEEAVVAKMRAKPFQRLFLHKSLRDQSTETVRWGEFGEGGLLWAECRGQDLEWYESDPVSELLGKVREIYDLEGDTEFRRIVSPPGERPRPLTVGTASQVGILPTQGVPSLLRSLLPPDVNGLCVAYLRDLLLNPPPHRVAASIQTAIRHMINIDRAIPEFLCVSAAKLVKLIGAEEANHLEFARIKNMAEDVLLMEKDPQLTELLGLLLGPTWLATGVRLERDQLIKDCNFLVKRLDEVLAPAGDPCNAISRSAFVPDEFFHGLEVRWKARVRRENVEKAYADVDRAAASLSDAVEEDFYPIVVRTKGLAAPLGGGSGGASGQICYSSSNGAVWFKGKRFRPTLSSGSPGEEEIKRLREAKDAKGKKAGDDWFTTDRVEIALEYYRCAVDRASTAVLEVLKGVAGELQCKLNTVVFIAAFSIIAKTFFGHACEAKRRRWVVPTLIDNLSEGGEQDEESMASENVKKNAGHASSIYLEDMFPYWLDKTHDRVILNSVKLESLFLLTGPNGGGKSSILRSICAAILLATCGLMVPARTAVVPRFDSIMLRMMISDSPADSKSSFQMEMSELRTILCEATEKSLVLVDELCKGTEVNKGTFIVASVLEHLDHVGCLGVISTHLHGLLDMDLRVKKVVRKAMGVRLVSGQPMPTWRIVDGQCRESLAFETARKEGVPESVVQRAEEFYQDWEKTLTSERRVQNVAHGSGKRGYVDVSVGSARKLRVESPSFEMRESQNDFGLQPGINTEIGITKDYKAAESQYSYRPRDLGSLKVEGFLADSPQLSGNGGVTCTTIQAKGECSEALNDLQHVFLRICRRKLSEMYDVRLSGSEVQCQCFVISLRQKPPPMVTNHSCVYILKRPDGKLYVGQTDNMSGRMERHRSVPGLHDASFLYVPLPNKSVACELETSLIKQLPSFGFSVVNKGDQNHRYFGMSPLIRTGGGETPPF